MELQKVEDRVEELLNSRKEHDEKLENKMKDLSYTEQYMMSEENDYLELRKIDKELSEILENVEKELKVLQEKKEELENDLENKKDELGYTEQFLLGPQQAEIESVNRKLTKYAYIKDCIENKAGIKVKAKEDKKPNNDSKKIEEENDILYKKGLEVIYNRSANTYTIMNERLDYYNEKEIDVSMLNLRKRTEFVDKLEEEYGENFRYKIEKSIDINLYMLLKEYDQKMGTNESRKYVETLDNKEDVDFKMTYNLRGRRKLGILDNMRLNKLANENKEANIAKVEKNTLKETISYAWKKLTGILLATGLVAGTAAIASLPDGKGDLQNDKKIEENTQEEKNTFKDELKVGTTGKISDGKYYYDSEKNGPTGKFDVHIGEDLEITKIAIVDKETGEFVKYGTEEEMSKLSEDKYAMVHVSHVDGTDCKTTDGGDLGWTDTKTAEQMVNEPDDER